MKEDVDGVAVVDVLGADATVTAVVVVIDDPAVVDTCVEVEAAVESPEPEVHPSRHTMPTPTNAEAPRIMDV